MKRTAFDESRDLRIANETGEPHGPMPCRWCSAPTQRSVLNALGARCSRCYAAYCCGDQPLPAWEVELTHEDKLAILERMRLVTQSMTINGRDPKAWAKALRERERRGEKLTPAQRDMWRAALGLGTDRKSALREDEA